MKNNPLHNECLETINLNAEEKYNQHDDLVIVLEMLRLDLSEVEILKIITDERIKRCVMEIDVPMIRSCIKKYLPEYKPVSVNKRLTLREVLGKIKSGKSIIRIGSSLIIYDADSKTIFSNLRELYAIRPVMEYWVKEDLNV